MPQEEIDRYIDKHRDDIARTLSALIQKKSLNLGDPGTGDEREVQDYLKDVLAKMGMKVSMDVGCDPKRENVTGLLIGSGSGRDLIFNSHADVVPPGDPSMWKDDPWSGRIEDGKVWGRGASDCKNGLATALWAIKTVQALNIPLRGNVYYTSTVGEESCEGCTIGATLAMHPEQYREPFAIIGEATDLEVQPVSSGLFFFQIAVPGKPVHVSKRNLAVFPHNSHLPCGSDVGVDALEKALPFIEYFYRLEKEWNFRLRGRVLGSGGYPLSDNIGVGLFTFSPVKIEGGMYLGSMMDKLTIKYAVWYPESAGRDALVQEIVDGVKALASTDAWLRGNPPKLDIPIPQIWRGFETEYEHPGVQALMKCATEALGRPAVMSGFPAVADATFIAEKGIPCAIFGSRTGGANVHGFNENADIDGLVAVTKTLAHMIVEWCQ
jgi:acetylornithine deacetylase/succinyl-diaminopimelate desuccinylase-like protein